MASAASSVFRMCGRTRSLPGSSAGIRFQQLARRRGEAKVWLGMEMCENGNDMASAAYSVFPDVLSDASRRIGSKK